MLFVFFSLLFLYLFGRDDGNTKQDQAQQDEYSRTLLLSNRTLHELGKFSGLFKLAGVRSFVHEQELENRIIGGQEAWAHSWPWQVSLRFASMPACGGAIISPLWVVSAAHCFRRYNKASFWTVLAGKHDLDNVDERGQQLVGVSAIVKHQRYDARNKDCDIALLKLKRPLVFDHFTRPINIWMKPLPLDTTCTVTGWGSTRENGPRVARLQEVNVTILPPSVCRPYYLGRVLPSMFCAGEEVGGADACQGDSGGPLSCFSDRSFELVGLVSWGVGCGRAKKPGVYTRIQKHTRWISDVINKSSLVSADELSAGDDTCGQQSSTCEKVPRLAWLSESHVAQSSVGNVSESCPFFWPWQVSLQASGRHYCSGALIHRHWVLAARHCSARAKEDMVVVGLHDLQFSASQTVPVDKVFNLPQDDLFPPSADLSLLRLSFPVRLGSSVAPVCVPDEGEELDDSWVCVTAGWGATGAADVSPNRLHHAQLTLVNRTSCKDQWGGGVVGDTHVCAHPAGAASCMGDSGAPLFCQKHGAYFLFGVVTWGSQRCSADKPSVFTRVSEYRWWISEVTGHRPGSQSADNKT